MIKLRRIYFYTQPASMHTPYKFETEFTNAYIKKDSIAAIIEGRISPYAEKKVTQDSRKFLEDNNYKIYCIILKDWKDELDNIILSDEELKLLTE